MNKYQESAQKEQNLLQDIEDYMGSYGLAENTPDTPAGTHVKPPAKWLGTMVTAVADGKGNTFPVPKNFYYVGGDYTNGVIISDDPADAYDGTTDKTTWEYTTSLVGNQFVWIPCSTDEYHKTDWGSSYVSGGYDSDGTARAEILQIAKYEGFYVARYEAGLADTIVEFTTGTRITNLTTGSNSDEYNVKGIPKSKAGEVPWNLINYINSKNSAENMYEKNEYVISGLITGTQWDVMLNKFIGTKNENGLIFTISDITNSSKWGNYYNNSVRYSGRVAKVNFDGNNWIMYPFGIKTDGSTINVSNNSELLTTGASKETEAYHIYDLAGNVWEWTEEVGQDIGYRVHRGGSLGDSIDNRQACSRMGIRNMERTGFALGFRVVLYLK